MIERSNNRLNAIFALWFLIAGIIPACIVSVLGYYFQHQAIIVSAQRELAFATQGKAAYVERYADEHFSFLEQVALTSASADDADIAQLLRSAAVVPFNGSIYGVRRGAIVGEIGADGSLWTPGNDAGASQVHFEPGFVFFARRISDSDQWLVIREPDTVFTTVLGEGFTILGSGDPFGRTADIYLTAPDGTLLTPSRISSSDENSSQVPVGSWLARKDVRYGTIPNVSFAGRRLFVHVEPLRFQDQGAYLIASIDRNEVLTRLKDQERLQLLAIIGSLIVMLGIIYMFVGMITEVLVRPIFKTITDVKNSTANVKAGIENAQKVMASEEAVASALLVNYRDQLKSVQAVDEDESKIAQSLVDINTQTARAAQSVQLIDALAVKGQHDAEGARAGLASIKKLATAHEALITTLTRYSAEVDAIASDVRELARAITYVSLNATIEASKTSRSMPSIANLASEVGKLSLLSKEASAHINVLVHAIQKHLSESKESSVRERSEAAESLRVITQALESLNRMSKDAMQISQSVQAIDRQVVRQTESAKQIAQRVNDLHKQTRQTMREATKINALAQEQKKGIKANSRAIGKLSSIVDRLNYLIGANKRNIWLRFRRRK